MQALTESLIGLAMAHIRHGDVDLRDDDFCPVLCVGSQCGLYGCRHGQPVAPQPGLPPTHSHAALAPLQPAAADKPAADAMRPQVGALAAPRP